MIAIIALLTVVFLSILITRIATIALTHTGMTKASARFQARSAFTGAGFTTDESESVVNHPVRRKIVMILILLGNAGIVASISSLILTFVRQGSTTTLTMRIFLLVGGLVVLWALASSSWVESLLARVVDRLLERYTDLNVTDYASLLHLTGDYRLAEVRVEKGDWIEGKTIAESQLRKEGVNVLGIKRTDGSYIGTVTPGDEIKFGDCLVVYGRIDAIKILDRRKEGFVGDVEHSKAVKEQKEVLEKEKKKDQTKEKKEEKDKEEEFD